MKEKKIIITGATGMVGGIALEICLESPDVSKVTVIGRSKTGIEHIKLRQVMADDFNDYSSVADAFANQDVALFCLGVYTGAVPDDLFREILVKIKALFSKIGTSASWRNDDTYQGHPFSNGGLWVGSGGHLVHPLSFCPFFGP